MRAHFGLPSVENESSEGRPPIQIKFEIPYFTVSGIQVYKAQYILILNFPVLDSCNSQYLIPLQQHLKGKCHPAVDVCVLHTLLVQVRQGTLLSVGSEGQGTLHLF